MSPRALTSEQIRKRLGFSRAEWARALNVNERTVQRWEESGHVAGGLASEVMIGISNALLEGADPARVSRLVKMGIGSLLYFGLINAFPTN